jgi:hypothetical protein
MSTIAFAAIPHFVVSHSKGKIAAKSTKAGLNLAKIVAAKKNVDPGVIYGTQPYVYRTSNRRAVKVQVVSGRNHAASPMNFELRAKKNEKVQTP